MGAGAAPRVRARPRGAIQHGEGRGALGRIIRRFRRRPANGGQGARPPA